MNRDKRLVTGVILISGIGLAAAVLPGTQTVSAQPYSGGSIPTTIVIRGSDPAAAHPPSANDTPPIVLRGSPPPASQPLAGQYACPSAYDYDPSYDCIMPGNAYNPYDNGYWPYYGFDGFFSGSRRHGFRHGFDHGIGRGFASRIGHPLANNFGHGFARGGGFGRR